MRDRYRYENPGNPFINIIAGTLLTLLGAFLLVFTLFGSSPEDYYINTTATVINYTYDDNNLNSEVLEYTIDDTVYESSLNDYDDILLDIGSSISIMYNPDNPEDILPSDYSSDDTSIYLFSLVFIVMGLLLIITSIRRIKRSYKALNNFANSINS